MRLRLGHQHSLFWLILARFVDYYSPFWGPRAITTINDSRGVFTCGSSTLAILAESGPFHGLLVTFWGSGEIYRIYETRGAFTCRSLTLEFLVQIWPVLWTIIHRLRARSDYHE